MNTWRRAGFAVIGLIGALAIGCSDGSAGDGDDDGDSAGGAGGAGGSGGAPPCGQECNDPECPPGPPDYPNVVCMQTGLACSYTFEGCLLDYACADDGAGTATWQASAPEGCEIPVSCFEGAPEGAPCANAEEWCDIPCSECRMQCGEDHRWHEVCAEDMSDCG